MSSDTLLGHGPVLEGLWRAARDRRLAHGLLVRGPEGIGKFLALRELATGLLCERGPGAPCRVCGPCKRVLSENHPDLLIVDAAADGQDVIKVGRIVQRKDDKEPGQPIDGFLSLEPLEGGWRVVLVREAERMNESAQNAFLKTLEEPGHSTLIALETAQPGRLLPTVRSRLVGVDLAPLSEAQARDALLARGLVEEAARKLARASRGAPGKALRLLSQRVPEMRELLIGLFTGRAQAAPTLAGLLELDGEFHGPTPAARERARARAALDLGIELLADLRRMAAGVGPGELAHGEVLEEARCEGLDVRWDERQRSCLEAWLLARQDLDLHLNGETLLDRALQSVS